MKTCAIIGFGALGKTIFNNLLQVEKIIRNDFKITAICNDDISTITKSVKINIGNVQLYDVDFSKYNLYTDYKEMLEKEKLDFVFIALPSFLHGEVCTYCLNKGLDVYVEKPMAITMNECETMLKAAKDNNRKLMVGHCLRFTNEYMYLKKLIDAKEFGKPVKAEFSRKSPLPVWTAGGWILDESKSGGCLVDMHVHDVDIVNWLFGVPEKVTASATNSRADFESAFALYQYPDMVVSVIGDWGIATSYEFEAKYAVTFEKAYVESVNGKVTLYTDDEKKDIVFDDDTTCYYREVLEFVDSVVGDKPFTTADVDSVYETMKIVFAEKDMARKN